jgi:hypothetical protein
MDWNLGLGIGGLIVGLVSLIFSAFQHYRSIKNEEIETTKRDGVSARLDSAFQGLRAVHENLEALVRRSKEEGVSARELRYLARATRAQTVATLNTLHSAGERLRSWQYGSPSVAADQGLLDQFTPLEDTNETADRDDAPTRA